MTRFHEQKVVFEKNKQIIYWITGNKPVWEGSKSVLTSKCWRICATGCINCLVMMVQQLLVERVRLVSNRPHSRTWRLESAVVFFVLVVFHIFMLGGAVPNFHQAGSHGRQSFLCYSNKKSPFLLMQELFVFLHSTTFP